MPTPEAPPGAAPDPRPGDEGVSSPTGALLAHYDAHRRSMPWRETDDPYAIWVSEVMLQQTRVDTVIPYWERWLDRFPTVEALAEAELDDVLKHWEGLGYYSRARNLHGAARVVRERHAGRLPSDPAALRDLPGVGEYTAGAVASIAFGVATPAVDGNVRRVLARLYDLESPTPAVLRDRATALVPRDRPGDFNQALMELGATICTPRAPACDSCPVASWCEARRSGVQELRPAPRRRKPIPEEEVATLVALREDGALLLVRRPEDGLLAGLWEFPGGAVAGELERVLAEGVGGSGQRSGVGDPGDPGDRDHPDGAELRPVVHTFSHKRVTYRPRLLRVRAGTPVPTAREATTDAEIRWVRPDELDRLALPVAQQKIARQTLTPVHPT